MKSEKKSSVPAVTRAFNIIDFVSNSPGSTFTEIRKELDIPKSSLHLMLGTLVALGILRISSDDGYTLGLRLFELGSMAVNRLDVRREARPLMQQLVDKVQLTCHLGILEGNETVYLIKVECQQAVIVNSWEGKRGSLTNSAMGKSLLLLTPRERVKELVQSAPFIRKTPKSITNPEQFLKHLELAKVKGWTIDDEEDVPGIRCISTPLRGLEGQPFALSITGPVDQVPDHRLDELAACVMETAKQISHKLGVRCPQYTMKQ